MDINNSVIVITGAAQGLGHTMALNLAKKGATLALVDLDPQKLELCQADCLENGSPKVATYICNVADEAQVEATFAQIPKDLGGLNGLINNAGILRDGLLIKQGEQGLKKMSLQNWQSVIDVNLTGVFLCGREFALQAIEHEQNGCIINISSISRAGNMGQSNYSAAKAGVASLSVAWAKELARYKIRANSIAPGFIETDMTAQIQPEVLDKITKNIPLRRMGQPEEIAHSAVYLLENEYMSGRVIEVDGGLRL